MSDVFLFPGQGSEAPGMGGAARTRPGPVRDLLQQASRALQVDLDALIARGSPLIARTDIGQPALTAIGLGLALELRARDGVVPLATAGHSVGELSAFCIAGCLEPEEAMECVLERSRLMAQATTASPGGMAALHEEPQTLAADGLELAAHNSPNEWVVTGTRAALSALAARVATVCLPVSGAWHSRFMTDAGAKWRARLDRVDWRRPKIPLVANGTGQVVHETDDLAALLAAQLTQPVRWAASMQTLEQLGGKRWHLFGPARVLRGLCRANLAGSPVVLMHEGAELPAGEARA